MGMFSLEESLIKQGVTCTTALKMHKQRCYRLIKETPSLRAHRYRVPNPNVPNQVTSSKG